MRTLAISAVEIAFASPTDLAFFRLPSPLSPVPMPMIGIAGGLSPELILLSRCWPHSITPFPAAIVQMGRATPLLFPLSPAVAEQADSADGAGGRCRY